MTDSVKYFEFSSSKEMIAAKILLEANSIDFEIFSPFQIADSGKNSGISRYIALTALVSSIISFIGIIIFLYYTSVIDYPVNTGAKPAFSFISFLPVIFETTILFTGISIFTAFVYKSRLGTDHLICRGSGTFGIAVKIEDSIIVSEILMGKENSDQ